MRKKYFKFKPMKLDENFGENTPIADSLPMDYEECSKEEYEAIQERIKKDRESFERFINENPMYKRLIEE